MLQGPGTVEFAVLQARLSSRALDHPAEGKSHCWPEGSKAGAVCRCWGWEGWNFGGAVVPGVPKRECEAHCGAGLHRRWEGGWTKFWVGICVSGTPEVWLLSKPRHGPGIIAMNCVWCHCLRLGGRVASCWQWQCAKLFPPWGHWASPCCKDSSQRQPGGDAALGPSLARGVGTPVC